MTLAGATDLSGLLADHGIRVRRRAPGVWVKTTCPKCEGGKTREESLSVRIDDDSKGAIWKCHRGSCGWEGNCDGCFLKGRAAILRMAHDHPERMQWWADMEAIPRGTRGINRLFRKDREDYAALLYAGQHQLVGYDETMIEGGEPCDAGCGI